MTTENKVLEILQCIDASKAAGIDKISGRFLKDGANVLAKPMAEICNTPISSGLFPNDYKIAKLKPFNKKGFKASSESFRPISLLGKTIRPTSASLSLMTKHWKVLIKDFSREWY